MGTTHDLSQFPPERQAKILEMKEEIATGYDLNTLPEGQMNVFLDRVIDAMEGNYVHPVQPVPSSEERPKAA